MPRSVHVLALGVFAMVTSEFVVAGLMPQMAQGLHTTVPRIGYLITAFALAMALGGPLLTVALLRVPPRRALLVLFALFVAGNVLAACAPGYGVMVAARVLTGAASQGFFGVAISLCVRLVEDPGRRGRAVALVLNGLMLGTLLGLPLSTLIGTHLGWRAAFWAITLLALVAALCTVAGVPAVAPAAGKGELRSEAAPLRVPRLWLTFGTSTLVIGATFSAFSYANPILTGVSGFAEGTVPVLLIAYGAATVVGNTVVGRLADRWAPQVVLAGLALNGLFLACFALFTDVPAAALGCFLGIGLVGVTLNPALVTRVHRVGGAGPLVNTVHSSFITLGIVLSSALGGLALERWTLRAPLWLGAGLAVFGLVTVLPEVIRGRGRGRVPAEAGAAAPAGCAP